MDKEKGSHDGTVQTEQERPPEARRVEPSAAGQRQGLPFEPGSRRHADVGNGGSFLARIYRAKRRVDEQSTPVPWLDVVWPFRAADDLGGGRSDQSQQGVSGLVQGSGLNPDQALRVLTVLDAVFQSNMARNQIRDSLIESIGSAEKSWHRYRLVLVWWAFRAPVAYLLIAGLAKFGVQSLEGEPGWSGVGLLLGAAFLVSMAMSAVSALRLLPVRVSIEPPKDWCEAEANFVRDGE